MSLLVVNHHYVVAEAPERPRAIFPVAVTAFEDELRTLGRAYEFVTRDDVVAAAAGEKTLPENACLITFDDGLQCQLDHAVPVLERLGVPFLIFVCGAPLAERRALRVHKVHALRELMSDDELFGLAQAELARVGTEIDELDDRAADRYRQDTPSAARVRYLLDMALPPAARDAFVDGLFSESFDEAQFCDELYLSGDDLAHLEREHGAIGAHSHEHDYLARLSAQELAADLNASIAALRDATGSRPRAISYPYGLKVAVSRKVAVAAEAAGFRVGFTMERALNLDLGDPLLLGRIDTSERPFGPRPLFSVVDGRPVLDPTVAAGRVPGLLDG
jgi:peptidoglycan/xylan/chitin deacetylase (PgdA/CDA1 family)